MRVNRFRCVLFLLPALLVALVVVGDEPASMDQPEQSAVTAQTPEPAAPPETGQVTTTAQQPVGTSYSVIYLDPETGYMGLQPPGMVIKIDGLQGSISTWSDDLPKFELERGGIGFDLKGRFQSLEVAIVTESGEVEVRGVDGSVLRQPQAATEQPDEGRQ